MTVMQKRTAQAILAVATLATMGASSTTERREERLPAPEFTDPCKCGSRKWRWSPTAETYICDRCGRRAS